jgi:DNA-binding phage protein
MSLSTLRESAVADVRRAKVLSLLAREAGVEMEEEHRILFEEGRPQLLAELRKRAAIHVTL